MTTNQCSLCGADIPEGAPHESWEWADRDGWQAENPDAPDPADCEFAAWAVHQANR